MDTIIAQAWAAVTPVLFAQQEETGVSSQQYLMLLVVLAVAIVPFVAGRGLAKMLRMPGEGFRYGLILLALVASAAVLTFGELKYGVDLRGGTILVYEIDPEAGRLTAAEDDVAGPAPQVTAEQLIPALAKRINPSGTQEIVVRPYGETQIEIIIPEVDQFEVDRIKRIIEQAGILRFAIMANTRDHSRLIQLAEEQAASENRNERLAKNVRDADGRTAGFWATVDREGEDKTTPAGVQPLRVEISEAIVRNQATGEILDVPPGVVTGELAAQWMAAIGVDNVQVLMAVDEDLDVTGEDLAFVSSGFDQDGSSAVRFKMNDYGSGRFFALTTNNAPDGNFRRRLGIVLDDNLLSAPVIQSPIQGDGQISGNFTRAEVDHLVSILQAGQLPAALTKQPIAENQIGSTLGTDTVNKGVMAIGVALATVLLFMLVYYRFSGVVSCLALVLNLAMTLAVMILINQPITLPGLAGLVLTVGMSVDANVLIFERIREELSRGAANRMAIRNGFARATTTIVDANLTTLITAIVLYAIGTDQVRGFAVTLILGILFSMFTAIYMSRAIFDIAERRGFVSLGMADIVNSLRNAMAGRGVINFLGAAKLAVAISLALMVAGVIALWARGTSIFDIDFAGGASVTFRLDTPTEADRVRELVQQALSTDPHNPIQFTLNRVEMAGVPDDTVYKVDAAITDAEEESVATPEAAEQLNAVSVLKKQIQQGFAAAQGVGLVTYEVDIAPTGPDPAQGGHVQRSDAVRLVALQPQEEPADAAQPAQPATDASAADAEEPADPPAAGTQPTTAEGQPADSEDAASTGAASEAAAGQEAKIVSDAILSLRVEGETQEKTTAKVNAATLRETILAAAAELGITLETYDIELQPIGEGSEKWSLESSLAFSQWRVRLMLPSEPADAVLAAVKQRLSADPVWISSSSIGRQVAGDMVNRAILALLASLICVIGYIWFRFQRVTYGLAAVAALIHDVLITLGAIAVSYWLADALGFLLIDPFKISLTVVAALLTIIGYSLNDTIVVFDRIRETKGKSPLLTADIINISITNTLSRTLLTSLTTLLVVLLLYIFGGEGIHAFAFSLVVGVFVGTYSSIFIASPLLLWMVNRQQRPATVR